MLFLSQVISILITNGLGAIYCSKNVYDPIYGNQIFGSHSFGDLETVNNSVVKIRQFFKLFFIVVMLICQT